MYPIAVALTLNAFKEKKNKLPEKSKNEKRFIDVVPSVGFPFAGIGDSAKGGEQPASRRVIPYAP